MRQGDKERGRQGENDSHGETLLVSLSPRLLVEKASPTDVLEVAPIGPILLYLLTARSDGGGGKNGRADSSLWPMSATSRPLPGLCREIHHSQPANRGGPGLPEALTHSRPTCLPELFPVTVLKRTFQSAVPTSWMQSLRTWYSQRRAITAHMLRQYYQC